MASSNLTYAGVSLPVWTATGDAWMRQWIDPDEVYRFDPRWNMAGTRHLALPPAQAMPPVEPGVLYWPTGATRWATYYAVVNGDTLDDIRYACANNGVNSNYFTPQNLVISDGNKTLTTQMYMLTPKPLSAVTKTLATELDSSNVQRPSRTVAELYLLTLVDERYYWWQETADITSPASWSACFSSIASALGVTITLADSTVPSAYGTPNANRWNHKRKPLPYLLDAAAAAIQRRVVRRLDGTIRVEDYSSAYTLDQAEFDKNRTPTSSASVTREVIAGGYTNATDRAYAVPASVDVVFLDTAGTAVSSSVNKTLASLSHPAAGSQTGNSGRVGTIYADMADPGSGATRDNYVTQIVTDYYGWRLRGGADIVYPGIAEITTNGLVDFVRYRMHEADATTRYVGLTFPLDPEAGAIDLGGESDVAGDSIQVVRDVECDGTGNLNVSYVLAVTVAPLQVSGRVTTGGVAVSGRTIIVRGAGGGATVSSTTTNTNGYYLMSFTGTTGTVEVYGGVGATPGATTLTWSNTPAYLTQNFTV